jgi:hypothetical protein
VLVQGEFPTSLRGGAARLQRAVAAADAELGST